MQQKEALGSSPIATAQGTGGRRRGGGRLTQQRGWMDGWMRAGLSVEEGAAARWDGVGWKRCSECALRVAHAEAKLPELSTYVPIVGPCSCLGTGYLCSTCACRFAG